MGKYLPDAQKAQIFLRASREPQGGIQGEIAARFARGASRQALRAMIWGIVMVFLHNLALIDHSDAAMIVTRESPSTIFGLE